ncbi:hypothetical protein ASPWEDRAFT_51744 [Aspergillus wentii DTO 134E9]|uniref:Uncharacterized protein n=1 Tax=Aspergillus wentii DTO 134E9 TaxID=1073089 RepID=A0A1L9RLS5_ASPWE|nr:uncharacterized protein ASPWEDRAFT_51744 [Aspergillus wentii DTO 134E9]OJJ35768.1 hypothetical protein ASPWEDRAFT_51744 [Aspergillus wentii DTO 134E9]
MWLSATAYFGILSGLYSFGLFLPTIINDSGFAANENQVQLWSVIPYAVAAILTVIVSYISDWMRLRGVIMLATLPVAIVGYAAIANIESPKVKYGMTILMATGMYSTVPCILVWNSNNSAGHYKRATTSGMQLAIANCGGFVATFIYPSNDKPQYHRGHTVVVALLVFAWLMILFNVLYCARINRDKRRGKYTQYAGCNDDRDPGFLMVLAATALRHVTRTSVWYAVGLLARNQNDDVDQALKIVQNVIDRQFTDPKDQWYGDYQQYPEEPTVGSLAYSPIIYDTWDPNWRGFIGAAFVIALEEFPDLINENMTKLMHASLYNATVGDSYRVGGVDDDNLYPSYTNPSLMRALVSGWTGRTLKDENMTQAGEMYANEIIQLFDRAETLSEFNSATYTGVSLIALTMWAKYAPESSIMKDKGKEMLQDTWKDIGKLYHADLKNLAGPWDRSYGFDMQKYFGIMSAHIWSLVGKATSPVIDKVYMMSHNSDFAISPLVAILSNFHNALVPSSAVDALKTFPGEHFVNTSAYSIPYDSSPRKVNAWLGKKISIGAESFNETVIGGPAVNPSTFNPAVIQWDTETGIGWIVLYATESALDAVVGPGYLNLTYPYGTNASKFQFLMSPFYKKQDVTGFDGIPGLKVDISGNVASKPNVTYSSSDETINDFMFWNLTYSMPADSIAKPNILLEVELE